MVLPFLVPSAAGAAPHRQVILSPACSIADGGVDEASSGVEVPGVERERVSPPGGGSSVDNGHTSAGTTDAYARGQRTLFQPLPLGLNPTGSRLPEEASSGSHHPETSLFSSGTHLCVGGSPDITTRGGGSLSPSAREPVGGSSSRSPQGSRSAMGASLHEHCAKAHGIGPPALGLGGRSPLGDREGGAMPVSAREPAG